MKRVAVALFVASLLLCGCVRSTTIATNRLTIELPINPQQLNAILPQNSEENFVDGLIYSLLVTIDNRGRQVPDLAAVVPTLANGGISRDGLTITYHLRKNVRWHDGAPFTSADVLYTWQQIMNPANNVISRHGFDQVRSMDTPDPYTIVLHMKRVFPPAVNIIFGEGDTVLRVLPKHLLAQYPNLNQRPFNSAPVGTGPYKFVRWLRGDRIILTANPQYFKGAPAISELNIKIILDTNTTQSQLRTRESDLAIEVTAPSYNALADVPGLTRIVARAPAYEAIFFNTSRPTLADPRVRRAIGLALDRETLLRRNTFGTATLAIADLSPFYRDYFPRQLAPLPYDPAQARALLSAAGWIPGPDGTRRKNGVPLSLQLVGGQGSDITRNISVELQQALRAVGIDVSIKFYDYATLYAVAQSGGILTGGKFDLSFYAWIQGADPDDSSSWLCAMIPPAGNNVTRYCSRQMDAAQARALSTFDVARRKEAYDTVQSLLLRDVPGVFLYYQGIRYAYNTQLRNFTPNGISAGWNSYQWKIAP